MSVLSKKAIIDRLQKGVNDRESIVITPLMDNAIDADAVNLRLGCYFRVPALSTTPCIYPYEEESDAAQHHYSTLVHKPFGRGPKEDSLILQPQHSVLASTLEYIKMPADASGLILTKSSWARYFVTIESAPWIHPLFRGCLTLEITNLGNVAIALPVGKPIAQLVFEKMGSIDPVEADKIEPWEDVIEGSYAGAVVPEAPKFSRK